MSTRSRSGAAHLALLLLALAAGMVQPRVSAARDPRGAPTVSRAALRAELVPGAVAELPHAPAFAPSTAPSLQGIAIDGAQADLVAGATALPRGVAGQANARAPPAHP